MTSDRGPEELADVEGRLTERFRAGLVVELEAPAVEVRRAILASRARLDGVDVSPDVLDAIAEHVSLSVRALEGALIRVVAYASLKGESPTIDLALHVLRRLGKNESSGATGIAEILDATARAFEISPQTLLARDRRPEVARARHVAMYMARVLTTHSLPEIGRMLGGRNHTTVLHAVNRISAEIETDPVVYNTVNRLHAELGPPADGRGE
jgi:chromosomal replication initiator protein